MENKINWQQKLSSRKFQAAVIGFVTALLVAFNFGEDTVIKVSGVVSSVCVLIAYIFAEAKVDTARIKKETIMPSKMNSSVVESALETLAERMKEELKSNGRHV